MIIKNSAVNIAFNRSENIKRKYILNEHILEKRFNSANILPIPDDAPSEIPRIIVKSKGEHSQLNIAPEAVNLQTAYTDEFQANWDLCEQYMRERIDDVFKLTDSFCDGSYKYVGIVAELIWDEINEEGHKRLFGNLFEKDAPSTLDDLVVKYTYIEDEKYYANITLQSSRIYQNIANNKSGQFTRDKLTSHTVSVLLDINDRYSFNNKENYNSDKDVFDELMTLTTRIIKEKLRGLVEKGDY